MRSLRCAHGALFLSSELQLWPGHFLYPPPVCHAPRVSAGALRPHAVEKNFKKFWGNSLIYNSRVMLATDLYGTSWILPRARNLNRQWPCRAGKLPKNDLLPWRVLWRIIEWQMVWFAFSWLVKGSELCPAVKIVVLVNYSLTFKAPKQLCANLMQIKMNNSPLHVHNYGIHIIDAVFFQR